LPSAEVGINLQHRFTPEWATTGGLPLPENDPFVGAVPPCPPSMLGGSPGYKHALAAAISIFFVAFFIKKTRGIELE